MPNDLSLEKLKISERLASLETSLLEGLKTNSDEHKWLIDMFTRIDQAIHGNGHPGMKTRLDRVEQTIKAFIWVIGVITTAVLGLIVEMIIKKH